MKDEKYRLLEHGEKIRGVDYKYYCNQQEWYLVSYHLTDKKYNSEIDGLIKRRLKNFEDYEEPFNPTLKHLIQAVEENGWEVKHDYMMPTGKHSNGMLNKWSVEVFLSSGVKVISSPTWEKTVREAIKIEGWRPEN